MALCEDESCGLAHVTSDDRIVGDVGWRDKGRVGRGVPLHCLVAFA